MRNNRVLITSVGSNTAIGVIKALRKESKDIIIYGTDTNCAEMCVGSSLVDHFYKVPNALSANYIKVLYKFLVQEEINCVIPIHDIEIEEISKNKYVFDHIFIAANSYDVVKLCNEKKRINEFLSQKGVLVPKTYSTFDVINSYPLIYKPNQGVSSRGIKIINNKDDWKGLDLENGIIQDYVKGVEVTVDCYSAYHSSLFKCCIRERIEVKDGISTKAKIIENKEIEDLCFKIHRLLNYKGVSNIQFIISNDKPFFIEINPRFAGAGILTYITSFNFPYWTFLESNKLHLSSQVSIPDKPKIGQIMLRHWQEIFLINNLFLCSFLI